MLSICIPIYNQDISSLISDIQLQENVAEYGAEIEVVLIDDGSDDSCRAINEAICTRYQYRYIQLDRNIGRASIRNRFLQYVKFEYLLFLDCDIRILNSDFISGYIKLLKEEGPGVVCGGVKYGSRPVERSKLLKWKYGSGVESRSAKDRQCEPYKSFISNNFIVRKDILNQYPFEERIRYYGHEDTLFGLNLMIHRVPVKHIDNQVDDIDYEESGDFIIKTETSIRTLNELFEYYDRKDLLFEQVRLLKTFRKFKKAGMVWLLRLCYFLYGKLIRYIIVNFSSNPGLFNFYKLLYLSGIRTF